MPVYPKISFSVVFFPLRENKKVTFFLSFQTFEDSFSSGFSSEAPASGGSCSGGNSFGAAEAAKKKTWLQ